MTDQDKTTGTVDLGAEVERLKSLNQNLNAKMIDYEKRWGWTKDHDPEAIKAKLEDYDNLRKQTSGGNPDAITKLIAEKEKEFDTRYSRKFSEYEQENNSLKREVKNLRVTSVAMQEAAKFFNSDGLPLLKPIIESQTDYVDGKIVVMDNGKPRPSIKDPRNQMEVGEWLEGLTKEYPSIAKSNAVGGAKPSGTTVANGGSLLSVNEYTKLSATDQQKYMRALPADQQKKLLNSLINAN